MNNQTVVGSEYDKRYKKYKEEIMSLYFSLYPNDHKAYDYFLSVLKKAFNDRAQNLKCLDEERIKSSDWYKGRNLIGMMMYVDSFAGNLQGVYEHLDYIESCGINYLHLMPLLESPSEHSDGGYAVSDFRKVQPTLGTMSDLNRLSDACHERGISVCLDFVMNHTSEDHEWAKLAKKGDPVNQSKYFMYDNWDIPNLYEASVPQVFPQTAPGNFTWCEEANKVVMTTFYPYQWDLNYANPMVFNDMLDNMLFLCNQGIDIIRLDAVPYIWKELYTSCRNLPQVHKLIRLMRLACEIVCPGTLLLGEVVMEPSKVVPYFGSIEKPECHLLYNVTTMATTWHTIATQDTRLLRHQLTQVFSMPKEYTFLNYLRCHDDIGWGLDYPYLQQFGQMEIPHKKYLNDFLTGKLSGSFSRGELYNDDPRLGDARLCGTTASLCGIESALESNNEYALADAVTLDIMLHAYMLTLSGIPVLYSGDEIAQLNDYTYRNDLYKMKDSRYLHRGKLDWNAVENLKDDSSNVVSQVFNGIINLEKLRRFYPVFEGNADVWIINNDNDHILGIGRYHNGEKLTALFNFSHTTQNVPVEEGSYLDLVTGENKQSTTITLNPNSFVWLMQNLK